MRRSDGHDFEQLNQQQRQQRTRVAAERARHDRRVAQQAHSHHLFLRQDGSYGTAPLRTRRSGQ
jgi:hypothetical protein